MLTIRGVYDGKAFRPLDTELLPPIHREVPVAIVFLEDVSVEVKSRQDQAENVRQSSSLAPKAH